MKNLLLWTISFLLIVIVGCQENITQETLPLPFYNSADFTPEWIGSSDPAYDHVHVIEAFQFTNQNGTTVSNADFSGKIYVANFFFTVCPSICPRMTSNMEIIHDRFQKDPDVMLLSHSVMPWVDSVNVLKKYAVDRGIDSDKWHFVTGDVDDIYSLARQSYFAEKTIGLTKNPGEFLHTENFILVDQKGRIRGVYNGTLELETERLIEDIILLQELG